MKNKIHFNKLKHRIKFFTIDEENVPNFEFEKHAFARQISRNIGYSGKYYEEKQVNQENILLFIIRKDERVGIHHKVFFDGRWYQVTKLIYNYEEQDKFISIICKEG